MSEANKNDGFLVPLPKYTTAVAIQELRTQTPAPNRGRNNEIILEEEVYLKNLEKVVNKTFFPLLHQADRREEARDFETSTVVSGVNLSVVNNDVDNLSINQYMAKYNSEDNLSFEKLMDKDEENWKKKHWWIAKQAEDYKQQQLAIQASSENKFNNMLEGSKESLLMLGNYEGQSNLMFMPTTKSKDIKSYSDPNSSEQKKIVYENTRLDERLLEQLNEKPESRQSTANPPLLIDKIKTPMLLGIDPKKKSQYSLPKPSVIEKNDNVRGFNVLSMPSPSPNSQTPMMTWGEIEGTPLILSKPKGFAIQETSARDKLTENLPLDYARKKKLTQTQQKQKMKEILTPTPMRRQSDLRMESSLLPGSKKIRKDSSQISKRIGTGSTIKSKLSHQLLKGDKKEILNSKKTLPDNLLHFD